MCPVSSVRPSARCLHFKHNGNGGRINNLSASLPLGWLTLCCRKASLCLKTRRLFDTTRQKNGNDRKKNIQLTEQRFDVNFPVQDPCQGPLKPWQQNRFHWVTPPAGAGRKDTAGSETSRSHLEITVGSFQQFIFLDIVNKSNGKYNLQPGKSQFAKHFLARSIH